MKRKSSFNVGLQASLLLKIRLLEEEYNFGPLDLTEATTQEIRDYYHWLIRKD